MIQHISLSPPICRWVEDGSLVDDGSGSFTNWYSNQPNGGESKNCMTMFSSYGGEWFDYYCDDGVGPAVCSKPIASVAAHNIIRA